MDARKLGRGMDGIGHYIYSLAAALPALAPDCEFLLFVDRELDPADVPAGCRQIVIGGRTLGEGAVAKLYSPWWMNVLVPRSLAAEGVQLFHGTNHVVPLAAGCPSVSTVHDLAFFNTPAAYTLWYRLYMNAQIRATMAKAARIIADSEATKKDIVRTLGVKPESITTIHLGVGADYSRCDDTDIIEGTRRTLGLPERFVLHMGVVQRRKNLLVLLRAARGVIEDGLIDRVVFAGRDGLGADEVRREATRLGLSDRVTFLGYVLPGYIAALYTMAAVVVMPSWYEGFGLPVLEAMACGTPVIASSASSLPEIAGGAALIFSPTDAVALERLLRAVLTDGELRLRLASAGLTRAEQFSWDRTAARHLEVYRRVLSEHGRLH